MPLLPRAKGLILVPLYWLVYGLTSGLGCSNWTGGRSGESIDSALDPLSDSFC